MRSLLYVPAHAERFISKAHERGADAVILDLEDAVPPEHKEAARAGLAQSIALVRQGGAQVFVRINTKANGQLDDALAACEGGADGLMVPKVESAQALAELGQALEPSEARLSRSTLKFIALIEDPGAVLEASAIARAPRLLGMALGGEDLALALGARPTPAVLQLPKLLVHYAAKANNLLSFGLLRSAADYSDLDAIAQAIAEAREHGFDGATCVHPSIVPLLNQGFATTAEELSWAQRVIAQAETTTGPFVVDGRMVDAPIIARARHLLGRNANSP
jgi:citrate lyase subunit beta / citryl-CoA lyase